MTVVLKLELENWIHYMINTKKVGKEVKKSLIGLLKIFEDLAVRKDNEYDSKFLDLCNIRHNIFDELCKQNSNGPQFSSQNICDAIQQLHSGKATDELGLAAEHFKNSPTTPEDLQSHSLGLKISTNCVGCPTCADDIAFLGNCHQELHCMLSVATHHAKQTRVTINPTKTKAVILNKPKNTNRSDLNWTLDNTSVYPSEDTTHLGLIRAELKENNLNIDARIPLFIPQKTQHILV
ncbi:unnamed protein product [Mytilus coruscus]|uniref:Reverse transcriptase domain-containing protein n=1 Tax=Mytilus coruscus TaxID=42192 RepID=A0A6J8CAL4_MYTCO|nr:unnamed protein product [Mytilus coruscus]